MNRLISVIIPCYNSAPFVNDLFNVVETNNNALVEWVFIDDCSDDNTLSLLYKSSSHFDNVVVISSQHVGAGRARNIGIEASCGKWIMFLDSDDLYKKSSIDKIIHFLENCSADVVLSSFETNDLELSNPKAYLVDDEEINHHMPSYAFWTYIIKKDFIERTQVSFFEYPQQDIETAFRYRLFANDPILVKLDYLFYIYRSNPTSNTHTWDHQNLFSIKYLVYKSLCEETKHKEDCRYLLEIARNCLMDYLKQILENKVLDNSIKKKVLKSINSFAKLCKKYCLRLSLKQKFCLKASFLLQLKK